MAFDYITTAIATLEGIRKTEKLIMMPETTCSLSHIITCDLGSVIVVQSKDLPQTRPCRQCRSSFAPLLYYCMD